MKHLYALYKKRLFSGRNDQQDKMRKNSWTINRQEGGRHMIMNTLWTISNFCLHVNTSGIHLRNIQTNLIIKVFKFSKKAKDLWKFERSNILHRRKQRRVSQGRKERRQNKRSLLSLLNYFISSLQNFFVINELQVLWDWVVWCSFNN